MISNYVSEDIAKFLQLTYFNNKVSDYLFSFLVFILGAIIVIIIEKIVLVYLKNLTRRTETKIDDHLVLYIKKAVTPLLYFAVFYLTVHDLELSNSFVKGVNSFGALLITLCGIRFIVSMIQFLIEEYWLRGKETKSLKGLLIIAKAVIWSIGIIFLLDNLGYKISTVIAGLGIGGIAVALAAQTVLGDLFSYIAILFDRPFEVGDFIIIDDKMGVVERIGIKTTRINSLWGEQLVFSNTDLTNSRIKNYKRMERRRVLFKLGVVYQTKHEHLEEIPKIIKGTIENLEDVIFDRAHFAEYGDFSLNFEIVYYIIGNDYNKYMDIHEKINLQIHEEFIKRGIEFAYPTQTLFMEKANKE